MHTKESVKEFIARYQFKGPNTASEIEDLPSILHNNEELIALLEGNMVRIHNNKAQGVGLLIATTRRVIFYRRSFIGTITREEFQKDKISSVSYRKGLMMSSICVTTSNNEAIIDYCQSEPAKRFADRLQKLINEPTEVKTEVKENDYLSKIEKLFNMKEKGILTEEEFLSEKKKLLSL